VPLEAEDPDADVNAKLRGFGPDLDSKNERN
jgi:hypothetical protein